MLGLRVREEGVANGLHMYYFYLPQLLKGVAKVKNKRFRST